MLNHQHIYSTLRSALVDRDRDPSFIVDNAVIVAIGPDQFALKQAIPSGALLVAYMLLFRPGFMSAAQNNPAWFGNGHYFLGGDANKNFPLFSNEIVASIAIAVGVYAGIIQAMPSAAGVHIRPRFDTPMVKETLNIMTRDSVTLNDAKDLFIELMQNEEFRLTVPVADDYIANPFIAELSLGIESSIEDARRVMEIHGEKEA